MNNERLWELEVGEAIFVETTLAEYARAMRKLTPAHARRPSRLAGAIYRSNLYTCVGAGSTGDIRYVIRTERIL